MNQESSSRRVTTRSGQTVCLRELGRWPYQVVHEAMLQQVTKLAEVSEDSGDPRHHIWTLQHDAVYTQGTACQMQTLLPSEIATVKTDRGGQITYHGPGQLILYPLLHLKSLGLGVKSLVRNMEQAVIDTLADYSVVGERREDAPGVYVDGAKIAALGLRIRRGVSYHGLSFNLDMDLRPFNNIDPCGYQGLQVTQLSDYVSEVEHESVREQLEGNFLALI